MLTQTNYKTCQKLLMICIFFITQDFQSVEGLTNILRDNTFLLVDEKMDNN